MRARRSALLGSATALLWLGCLGCSDGGATAKDLGAKGERGSARADGPSRTGDGPVKTGDGPGQKDSAPLNPNSRIIFLVRRREMETTDSGPSSVSIWASSPSTTRGSGSASPRRPRGAR